MLVLMLVLLLVLGIVACCCSLRTQLVLSVAVVAGVHYAVDAVYWRWCGVYGGVGDCADSVLALVQVPVFVLVSSVGVSCSIGVCGGGVDIVVTVVGVVFFMVFDVVL